MTKQLRQHFLRDLATNEELIDLAKSVFCSAKDAQSRLLAAYIVSYLEPDHNITEIDAEIYKVLAQMVEDGELVFKFPNRYQRMDNESPDGFVSHRTCRKCQKSKPLEECYGFTDNHNYKTKCLECEIHDEERSASGFRTCRECKEAKPLEEFGRTMAGNRKGICLSCVNQKVSETQRENHRRWSAEGKPSATVTEPDTMSRSIPEAINEPLPPEIAGRKHELRRCTRGRSCVAYEELDRPAPLTAGQFRWCTRCQEAKSVHK